MSFYGRTTTNYRGHSYVQPNSFLPKQKEYLSKLKSMQKIIFELKNENIEESVSSMLGFFDKEFLDSMNIIVYRLIYSSVQSLKEIDVYLKYLQLLETKEKEIYKDEEYSEIIQLFSEFLKKNRSQESYYILENMIEQKLIPSDFMTGLRIPYFVHYETKEEIKKYINTTYFYSPNDVKFISENFEELSKNNWELHKKYIKEGHSPSEIAKIIRNDEVDKLQEISSNTKFNFNQTIEPSLYERCSFINKQSVTLIDYAAFFGSIKCFKYLLMNNANVSDTGKYAVACGNEEIIHLCEQNHSSFEGAYETAIEFHRNKIFQYLYENKIHTSPSFIVPCMKSSNYEIISFFEKQYISESEAQQSFEVKNIFIVKYFLEGNVISNNLLFALINTQNIKLIKYALNQQIQDINASDKFLINHLIFFNIWWILFIFFETILSMALSFGLTEIVEILLNKKIFIYMVIIFVYYLYCL